ncbi:MAG: hypothetical protein IIU36_00925 [Firmicutes bacterium]|nr:hypothetical protein [Bacillota bacterium]
MYRTDGCRVHTSDAMYEIVPFIMPKRWDASNSIKVDIDLEKLQDYSRKCRAKGIKMSHMAILIAAYLRLASQNPLLNRFAMNKKIYARNHFCVCFVTLKPDQDTDTVTKVYFNLDDDIFTVNKKLEEAIEKVQVLEEDNSMDVFMHKLLAIPFLCRGVVGAIKLLDKYFTVPFSIVDISPFHTSLFVTNLASIRTDTVNHHLYEFGTTGVFISMGKPVKKTYVDDEGKPYEKKIMELGIMTDERIANGHYLGRCFRELNKYLKNPEILEEKPEQIKWDPDVKKQIKWKCK